MPNLHPLSFSHSFEFTMPSGTPRKPTQKFKIENEPKQAPTHALTHSLTHLRLDQHEIDKQHDIVMLDVLVGEPFTVGTLRQPDPFAERAVVGLAVRRVESGDRVGTCDADWHCPFLVTRRERDWSPVD